MNDTLNNRVTYVLGAEFQGAVHLVCGNGKEGFRLIPSSVLDGVKDMVQRTCTWDANVSLSAVNLWKKISGQKAEQLKDISLEIYEQQTNGELLPYSRHFKR